MDYRNLTSPELVKEWKKLVNDNVMIGRDAHLIKEFLRVATPVQILLGIHQYRGRGTITIPQFLKQSADWLEEDEQLAEIELARMITKMTPPEYYIYHDLCEEQGAYAFQNSLEARLSLRIWADRVLA